MRKKKGNRFTLIGAIIVIVSVLPFVGFLILREDVSPQTSTLPTYVLKEGESLVQVSNKLVTTHRDIRIGGGSVMIRDYVNSNSESVTGLTMVIDLMDERVIAYEGLEWDYKSYHLRVLEVFEEGSTMLAISSRS